MNQALKIRTATAEPASRRAREVDSIVSRCVHCGLCNATCPTYILERDERDGPRGRITMIEQMFASGQTPREETKQHIGRCLSCMACTTGCPAGVDYAHLIDHAKAYIRETAVPPVRERILNWFARVVVPYPARLRWLMYATPAASHVARALRWVRLQDYAVLADAASRAGARRASFAGPGTAATTRERRGRVILLAGCAQQVLRPDINDATIRLLARNGIDVEVAAGAGCCGAVTKSTGDPETARALARINIDAWIKSIERSPADAILTNAAGCGTAVKDYPHLLRDDPAYARNAAIVAGLAQDVCEFLGKRGLGPARRWSSLKVAYQASCRLLHGQGIADQPSNLIHDAGFTVIELPESHLCCGGSDDYALRQPAMAEALRDRKVNQILATWPDVVATGSIACLKHLERTVSIPVVHTVELLDWAHGGPVPKGLGARAGDVTDVPGPPPLDIEDYIRT